MTLARRSLLKALGVGAAGWALTSASGISSAAARATGGQPDWAALRTGMRGTLFLPETRGFDTARLGYNPLLDNQIPAAVAQCRDAGDVAASVRTAATRVPVAARSGGHSYGGYSVPDGGLVVDLSQMSTVDVRRDGTAVVGAGARLGDVSKALGRAGRCLPAGSCSTVGIGGLTLGGGVGTLTRKFGLTCDHLLAAEIVTADGQVRTVSAANEPDLFWALRGGGGGNFGIVTSFTFATEPAPAVSVFTLKFPAGSTAAVLDAWQPWIAGSAPEMWATLNVSGAAEPSCHISGCFVGPSQEANPLIDDLVRRSGVTPSSRVVHDKSYLDATEFFDGSTERQSFVATSRVLDEPADGESLTKLLRGRDGVSLIVDALGGAVSDVDNTATAFPHRRAFATAQIYASATPQNRQQVRRTVSEVADGMTSLGIGGGYVNYIDPAQPDWARAYYGPNLSRLRKVARTYDPDRVFAFPQSVTA